MSNTKTQADASSAVEPSGKRRRYRRGKPSRRRDLRGFWRTLLALIAPLPGFLMAAKIMISPFGMDADFASVLAGVPGDPAREQLALWLGLAFSLTVLPATLAVAWSSRRRSPSVCSRRRSARCDRFQCWFRHTRLRCRGADRCPARP